MYFQSCVSHWCTPVQPWYYNNVSYSLARVSTTEFSVAFWPMVVDLVILASQHPQRCEELFSLALTLFKRLAETSLEFINLEDVVRQWSSLLLYAPSSREVRNSFTAPFPSPNQLYAYPHVFIEYRSSRESWFGHSRASKSLLHCDIFRQSFPAASSMQVRNSRPRFTHKPF